VDKKQDFYASEKPVPIKERNHENDEEKAS
jgi:hypothetical protein